MPLPRMTFGNAAFGDPAQPMGAGANMSPGSQILALTANNASANSKTIKAGRSVVRKKDNALT